MESPSTPENYGKNRRADQKRQPKSLPRLREIAPSAQHFWKDDLDEYLTQQVRDRTYDSTNDRNLPANEIDALALNEIAVARKEGFFFFLPSRSSWSRQTFNPPNRGPSPGDLSASIPSLVFMRYTWSTEGQTKFMTSPHRSRYLACDFQLNPPPAPTPLYCIQVVSGPRYPIFRTAHNSFIVIRSNPLYFGTISALAPIIGQPLRKRKGPDAEHRLAQVEGCWKQKGASDPRFREHSHENLRSLYDAVIRVCHPTDTESSMTSGKLWQLIPRPLQPELGLALGRNPEVVSTRSRFGGRLSRHPPNERSTDQAVDL
ncbi:hypothetical protein BM1_02267 [Bipolaris maydis]|nr:hypothetical protein BM1_02267 [Bipolaris maydis]